jgi:type II secretory pathway pseudopilin PulG
MRHPRTRISVAVILGLITTVATLSLAGQSPTASGQSPTTRDVQAAKEAERKLILSVAEGLKKREAAMALPTNLKDWKPGRTPWGDPDLSGVYSNSDESGIPFERPAQFDGRRLEDISSAELDKLRQQRRDAVIDRAASAVEDPEGHPQLFWWENLNASSSRAWLVVDPTDGRIPPTTPDAQKRVAARQEARKRSGRGPADGPEDRSLYDRCISRGLPGSMMPAIYGSSYSIVQGPNTVAITYEMIHETRVIPLDSRPHVGKAISSYMGDARGHFEGNTLVVETTNFKDQIAYRNANGATLKIVERFTPVNPRTVEWSTTIDDPATWTRPWTFAMNLTKKDPSQQPFEYACHEGNYGLKNILSGARAEERARAAGK